MILRATVSGGLEGLAQREFKTLLPAAHLRWTKRGNSGSQLEIEIIDDNALDVEVIRNLHFVEYLYYRIGRHEYSYASSDPSRSDENLLRDIQKNVWEATSRDLLKRAVHIGREIQHTLQNCQVGLEPLAGQLLPTPDCSNDRDNNDIEECTESFHTNTIYTKPSVAKNIIETLVGLVRRDYDEHTSNKGCEGTAPRILWLDAGAGSGALFRHLPEPRVGVDVRPRTSGLLSVDFLKTTRDWLVQSCASSLEFDEICVVSNPPFSDGSRGDYSSIVQFANHASTQLKARFLGLIVPSRFARQRIWDSLGMDPKWKLRARFYLPQDSFFDPSSGTGVHIHSYFLFFAFDGELEGPGDATPLTLPERVADSFYLQGRRNKGDFPNIKTSDLTKAVAQGLSAEGQNVLHPPLRLCAENCAEFLITVNLNLEKSNAKAKLELFLLLNSAKPLSLVNCESRIVPEHSLGWMPTSIKPPVARGMLDSAGLGEKIDVDGAVVIVNCMCGEGTIELEVQAFESKNHQSCFILSGDNREVALEKSKARLETYRQATQRHVLVEHVLWDAENLPLRPEIADILLCDLPFSGGQSKKHSTPTSHNLKGSSSGEKTIDYRRVMIQAFQVLSHGSCASVISADTKALVYAVGQLNWRTVPSRGIQRIGIGGINAQMLVLEKSEPCHKDLSVWMKADAVDMGKEVFSLAVGSVARFNLDADLVVQEGIARPFCKSLINNVKLIDAYFHEQSGRLSHCYRFFFDARLTNTQTKYLEKAIRQSFENNYISGMTGMR